MCTASITSPMSTAARRVRVASDTAGIRTAMAELCEHSLLERKAAQRIEQVLTGGNVNAIEQVRKLAPRSRISPGYQDWTLYLLWLEGMIAAGVQFEKPITAEEAEGLRAVDAARSQWNYEHPPCPNCGARLANRAVRTCFGCGKEVR